MLTVTFQNDGTGNEVVGNYDYKVYVNNQQIAEGRIENHNRISGWQGLVTCLAVQTFKGEIVNSDGERR